MKANELGQLSLNVANGAHGILSVSGSLIPSTLCVQLGASAMMID